MDTIGTLELNWAQGYNGGQATYIEQEVLCYLCGNNVKFIAEDGSETVFSFPGEGTGPLAVHPISRCFAVAEQCINPKIFVYVYPTFREMIVLEGGAQLEYSQLLFSNSDYMASLSGIPDFALTLWNFVEGTQLATFSLNNVVPTSLSFNPGNWRQICVTMETGITILQIEQSDDQFLIQPHHVKFGDDDLPHRRKLRLPAADPLAEEEEKEGDTDLPPTRSSTRMSRYTVDIPKAARAGLVGEIAEELDDIQDETKRVVPMSHTWTPIGDLYIGCQEGHIMKVDGEIFKATVLYYPPKAAESPPGSRLTSAGSKRPSAIDLQATIDDVSHLLLDGSANCICLHKRGLYCCGQDGVLRLVDLKSPEFRVIEKCAVGAPITSLSFSSTYRRLALGSSEGAIYLYEPGVPETLKLLKDLHHGNFVGVACLAGNEYCVSCREDGLIQVWGIDRGMQVSSLPIGVQVTAVACSPMLHVCVVGTVSGHIYFVDLVNPTEPRVVERVRVYQGPVRHLVYEMDGKYLFTASEDGHVFVVDGKATSGFKPLAHTDITGEIQSISSSTEGSVTRVIVTHNTSGNKRNGANRLTSFFVTDDIMKDLRKNVKSLRYDFKDASINKMAVKLGVASYGGAVGSSNIVYTLSQQTKKVNQITLPNLDELPPEKERDKFILEATEDHPGHELPGGQVLLSPHQKWLASFGPDGNMSLRTIGAMDRLLTITPHDYRQGGINAMAFSEDSQHIFTTGFDGILTCYSWQPPRGFSPSGVGKAKSAVESSRAKKSRLMSNMKDEDEKLQNMPEWSPGQHSRPGSPSQAMLQREEKEKSMREEALLKDEIYKTPTPTPASDATWLDVQELESFKEEDRQYATVKKNLRVSIRDMRRTLQAMLKQNEDLPAIEQLNRHEFDLDIEEQMRLQGDADLEVQRVREEIEFENLAKMYLREMIKKECWDDMVVKGRAIQAFNSNLEVSNFPMRERSQNVTNMVETVKKRRKVELLDSAARKEMIEHTQKPAPTTAEDELVEGEEEDGKEQPSTTGSLGAQYGGGNELFYSQFELHTREQKVSQIVLLEDAIFRIRQVFNKEFDDLYVKKEQEISKIKEKNRRIRKIIADLDLVEEVIAPEMGIAEKPERLLEVEDSEVKVEKYYTLAQKKEMEKKNKEEADRKAREKGDNARDRALQDMMGGVLEVKKEDELKKDVPKPAFMTQKAEADWSEDEQKLVKDFERKVKELQEEREKYRKQLETELRKNQTIIQEGMVGFDEFMNQVFMKKIKVMMVIYQEELKIQRLRYSLLIEEELGTREAELNRLMEHKKNMRTLAGKAMSESRKHVEDFREQFDILMAEDKVMERGFKREFNDVAALQQDQLYKQFRRRPRRIMFERIGNSAFSIFDRRSILANPKYRGQKATKSERSMYDQGAPNPFSDRPSTARQNAQSKAYMDSAMEELDREANCPDGVEPYTWEKLCSYRRQKIDNEQLVKVKAQMLAEMNAFLQKRTDEEEALKNEIDGIVDQMNTLQEDRNRFNLNLEVQLLLKQGQVEVDSGSFIHDYKDSALIHRSVVEDLNHTIKQLGESKIASMVESKDFRKGIIQLEWEHKKMVMQIEDFQNKMKDIQFMKVTREIQLYLNSPDYDGKKSDEISKLEQTILTQKRHHEKTLDERKRSMKDLGKTVKQRQNENEQLMRELEDLNVSVYERRHIEAVNADRRTDSGADKRYAEIVQRRKLVDLAKAQAQEVAVLRAEVERLRMRTFPALVQVEH